MFKKKSLVTAEMLILAQQGSRGNGRITQLLCHHLTPQFRSLDSSPLQPRQRGGKKNNDLL